MKSFVKAVVAAALFVLPLTVFAQDAQTPDALCAAALPAADPATREYDAAPDTVIEPGIDYRAIFCTSAGPVYIDLLENETPLTVNNFVFLAQEGYYNNTTFHRVIESFMAQGGDPTATGTGGPGYQFEDEFVGFLHFDRPGWLAMANAGPGTNGSQFFITTTETPHLDYMHTIFGEVIEGQANAEAIELRDPASATTRGTTLDTVLIVTDPASVTTTYEAPIAATEDELQAVITQIADEVPAPLSAEAEQSGIFTSAIVTAGVAESAREAFSTVLDDNGFQYRAQISVANSGCDLEQAPYTLIRYTLDTYADRESAAAALSSGVYAQAAEAAGYAIAPEFDGLTNPVYTQAVTACETESVDAITQWQRGQYVVTARATLPTSSAQFANLYLTDLISQIFERYFSTALRAQLR